MLDTIYRKTLIDEAIAGWICQAVTPTTIKVA
jgi:hypothetical protein